MIQVKLCDKDTHTKFAVPRPFLIDQYNKLMEGVDRANQNILTYCIAIESKIPGYFTVKHRKTLDLIYLRFDVKRLSDKIYFISESVWSSPRRDFAMGQWWS